MHQSEQKLGFGCLFAQRCCHAASLIVAAGVASCAVGQVVQEPIGAVLRYEVAVPGGPWVSSLYFEDSVPHRVEWRAVLSFTGTHNAAALGRIYYQPVLSNVFNSISDLDQLGTWRNGGVSGQGTTSLAQGLLSVEEGNSSQSLASYGRVHYGFTSRTTTAGNSGALTGIRHSSDGGSPTGNFIRIAGSNNTTWYEPNIPNGSVPLNTQILWGVVSDNPLPSNTWFLPGTQDIVLMRQAFIPTLPGNRTVVISSEAATLQRAGGSSGTDDTRFMTWALPGEGAPTASIRVGVQYQPATITYAFPSPGTLGVIALSGVFAIKRRRGGDVTTAQMTIGGDQ